MQQDSSRNTQNGAGMNALITLPAVVQLFGVPKKPAIFERVYWPKPFSKAGSVR
jgi:hypothetical protein